MPWRLLGVIPLLLGAILNLMADGDFEAKFGDEFREYRKKARRWI